MDAETYRRRHPENSPLFLALVDLLNEAMATNTSSKVRINVYNLMLGGISLYEIHAELMKWCAISKWVLHSVVLTEYVFRLP